MVINGSLNTIYVGGDYIQCSITQDQFDSLVAASAKAALKLLKN